MNHIFKTSHILLLQLTMNDFSVHRIIGRGGFGEVYGCRKADTGKMWVQNQSILGNVFNYRNILLMIYKYMGSLFPSLKYPHIGHVGHTTQVLLCLSVNSSIFLGHWQMFHACSWTNVIEHGQNTTTSLTLCYQLMALKLCINVWYTRGTSDTVISEKTYI